MISRERALSRGWRAMNLLAVLGASACGEQQPEGISSTLQAPARPGDAYGLVKTLDYYHVISHIAVGGNSLFFGMPRHGVYGMPKYGGDVTAVERDTNADQLGLVISGDKLLWLKARFDSNDNADDFLLQRPVAGGPTTVLRHGYLDTMGYDNFNLLVADATHVYFLSEAAIEATPVAGGDTEQIPVPTVRTALVMIAADYPSVYFTGLVAAGYALSVAELPGGASRVLATVSEFAQIVGLDASAVFILDPPRLLSVARADGAETELIGAASGIGPGSPAVIDDRAVYFFGTDPAAPTRPALRLMSIPKSGGAPVILGSDARTESYVPWDIASDDQFVFVLTSPTTAEGGNEILAFPKTPSP